MIQIDPKTLRNQEGNVALWIFFAIILFGVLAYNFSKGSRSTGTNLSQYQTDLIATDIIDYARSVRETVQELRINGCRDTEISFENSAVSGYTNANAPSDNSCHVFHPNGGGLRYQAPEESWLDPAQSASNFHGEWFATPSIWIAGVGSDGSGSNCTGGAADGSCRELLIGVPYLKSTICQSINKQLGWGKDSLGTPIQDSGVGYAHSTHTRFTGTYAGGNQIGTAQPTTDNFSSITNGCIEGESGPTAGTYHFFQVLIAR